MSRRASIIIIVAVSALLRCWAALQLPVDFDEPIYMQASLDYAEKIQNGDWDGVIEYAGNREHPPLIKLLYGVATLLVDPDAEWMVDLYASRMVSVLFGTLAVLLLALADPLAGALLAGHTLVVKYTSQAYLEALPLFAALAALLAMRRVTTARDRWFWLSAAALGVTAAGKYTYLLIVPTLLYLAVWEKRWHWRDLLLYGALAMAVFWLLNPTLWHNPISRLTDEVSFHLRYSQSAHVRQIGYPWYQPLLWISRSSPPTWHPRVFFYPGPDGVIFWLAVLGLYWEWRERRWIVFWIATSFVLLLLWSTKWPQYTLVLIPALCLAASTTIKYVYHRIRTFEEYWAWLQLMVPRPSLSFWILTLVFGTALLAGYTILSVQLTLARLKWSHITTHNSQLPSNTIHDVLTTSDGRMLLATEYGAALWTPSDTAELPHEWDVFTIANSGLPHNRVLAVAQTPAGDLWFGTQDGLSRYDGANWQTLQTEDVGLAKGQVHALAVGSDGRLWVGTSAGAVVFDGQVWTPFTTSGPSHNWVLSLAVEPRAPGDQVWFGTRSGVSRFDTASGEWADFTSVFDPEWGGVPALTVDTAGNLWAGTLGGGLGFWNGADWQFYRTGNSDIPFNTVNAVAEIEPGVLWVGTARPATVGGVLAEFDGRDWKTFTQDNSGYSGGEPLCIAQDAQGRRWVGTRTHGIDIYQP